MIRLVLRVYDFFHRHRFFGGAFLTLLTLALAVPVLRLDYKEDIADFLPLGSEEREALSIYQDIAGAGKIMVVFQYREGARQDPELMVRAICSFAEVLSEADTSGLAGPVIAQMNLFQIQELQDFVNSNIPYFLSDADYERIDSLLALPDYISRCLEEDRRILMFPSGALLTGSIRRDPLMLFSPVTEGLQRAGTGMNCQIYDGCIFSPDMSRAIVVVESPYGASETKMNALLVSLLGRCVCEALESFPDISAHFTGGPVIAVDNASQIRRDSVLSVTIALILILGLLFFSFRKAGNLLLIALSIAWGWLFAVACLAMVHSSVSIIVLGISSIVIGIAVNYPLHYIAHLEHCPDKRRALREIVVPLVVGNVTTVGAFLTLVPLKSVALRDLGLFAAFLLVGTILFSICCLPQLAAVPKLRTNGSFIEKLSDFSLENKSALMWIVAGLTLVFGFFSLRTGFDANMSHINYMSRQQREDMDYLSREMTQSSGVRTVYSVSSGTDIEEALQSSEALLPELHALKAEGMALDYSVCNRYISSKAEQARRLTLWNEFKSRHKDLPETLTSLSGAAGFSSKSFTPFLNLFEKEFEPRDFSFSDPLVCTAFSSNFSYDNNSGRYSVVGTISVAEGEEELVNNVKQRLCRGSSYGFDVESMNSSMAGRLSDNFNYIGWACGCIVFFFLWLSLGSLELALLSFIPMAVSWLWILGIMGIFGLHFNIVNIILATFIFGQGDDYTIFMTEGACYEYAYRRRMLSSYKRSIIISALVMFIGIGTLIFAKHPALRSLAQLTIAGMFSVVLMAALLPPFIFNFLTKKNGEYRIRPLSFNLLFEKILPRRKAGDNPNLQLHRLVRDRYRYKGAEVFSTISKNLRAGGSCEVEVMDMGEGRQICVIRDKSYGELALVHAMSHPEDKVLVTLEDGERALMLRYCAEGVTDNLLPLALPTAPATGRAHTDETYSDMKDTIRQMLAEALPLVNLDSDCLFEELDSLGVASILLILSEKFGISLKYTDVTPKNFMSVDSLSEMVKSKLGE